MSNSLQELAVKAVSDPVFRSEAKRDPRAALAGLGLNIPASVSIKVYENSPSIIHAVLPEKGDVGAMKAVAPYIVKVFEKAWSDARFKAELLKDPKRAIREATNASVPARLDVVVHENTDTEMSFVLPYVGPVSGELSDADLEAIAGGKGNPSAGGCGDALATQGAVVTASAGVAGATGGVLAGGAAVVAVGTMFSSFITMAVSASK